MLTVQDFLGEFEEEHFPREFGPWIQRDAHDPPFALAELDLMRRMGLIQIRRAAGKPLAFRLTLAATKRRTPNVKLSGCEAVRSNDS